VTNFLFIFKTKISVQSVLLITNSIFVLIISGPWFSIPMIIAVNTRLLLRDRLEGIGWFTHENLKRITAAHPEHTFLFLFDRPFSDEFIYSENIRPLVVPPPARHPLLWYVWFEISLPGVLRKHKADLYIGPDGYMPLRLDIPSLVTIHDINFHHRPMDLPWSSRLYYRKYFPRFAGKADRITTVSEYSRSDIAGSYGIDPEKIDVVYNGVNEIFAPLAENEAVRKRKELSGGIPYFIFVGSMHPRKNLSRLLLAFDLFREELAREYKLVIVGEKMFMTREIEKTLTGMKHRKDIIFTGRLSPEKLRDVMGASAGLTFLPLFEGFGIPLLEAMRCEIPILASDATSLPEIAAEAAIYANPQEVPEIVAGMLQLAGNAENNSRLVNEGRERVKKFSWDLTSERMWNSVCRVIEQC
jgi:glycosyltransferase involved in cell wall biosynthesis